MADSDIPGVYRCPQHGFTVQRNFWNDRGDAASIRAKLESFEKIGVCLDGTAGPSIVQDPDPSIDTKFSSLRWSTRLEALAACDQTNKNIAPVTCVPLLPYWMQWCTFSALAHVCKAPRDRTSRYQNEHRLFFMDHVLNFTPPRNAPLPAYACDLVKRDL